MYKLNLEQPPTKKKVIELIFDGWLGNLFTKYNWAGFTLPLPFVIIIMYWVGNGIHIEPSTRVHEFVHVQQTENEFFLKAWWDYLSELVKELIKTRSLMNAYKYNKYEVEAYNVEGQAYDNNVYPSWAK